MAERAPTGVEGLDEVLSGGFPRGSLIVLAGNPGTGKTVFSMQFLVGGVERGEPGVYVSFAEGHGTLIENLSSHLGVDLAGFESEDKLRILDYTAMREDSMSAILGGILGEVEALEAKRLVIDSFSAMAQAYKEAIDVRVIAHTILGKIVRQMGCTTIMIEEVPLGEARIGRGIEEFVADGLIILKADKLDGRVFRDLEIVKLRGMEPRERSIAFTLKGGFKALPPLRIKPIIEPSRFQPISDPRDKISTGSEDLDAMLGGGIPKGSSTLIAIAEKISAWEYQVLIDPIAANSIAQGRGVLYIPSIGVGGGDVVDSISSYGFDEDEIHRFMRICEFHGHSPGKPYFFTVEAKDISVDFKVYAEVAEELEESTGKPTLAVAGLDTLTAVYGEEACMKALSLGAARIFRGAALYLANPSPEGPAEKFSPAMNIHLKLTREHGVLLLYGVKPRTSLYALDVDASKGYPMPRLTPIV
ncbi:MAG: ATPase domain-containing protein [Candidatus Bathyarchaeia archaeon]